MLCVRCVLCADHHLGSYGTAIFDHLLDAVPIPPILNRLLTHWQVSSGRFARLMIGNTNGALAGAVPAVCSAACCISYVLCCACCEAPHWVAGLVVLHSPRTIVSVNQQHLDFLVNRILTF